MPTFFRVALLVLMAVLPSATWASSPITDHYFKASDGKKLHYLEAGSGSRTVVFIPGWLMPASIFEQQLTDLSGEFRVLAFDPRSQGLSEVSRGTHAPERRMRDLEEFLKAAEVGDFVLAGWSLGVMESLDYVARRQPPGLRGMVLIDNSIGEGTPPPARSSNFFEKMAKKASREAYLTQFCRGMFNHPPPPRLERRVLASALRVPPAAAKQLINQPYPRTYWRDTVLAQTVPVLYAIRPRLREQGEILLRKKGADLAKVVVFEEAGHALFVDEPDRFNRLVESFADRAFSRPRF